jgi:hypothetical protein
MWKEMRIKCGQKQKKTSRGKLDIIKIKKVKIKFAPEQSIKNQRGSRGITLLFL